MNNDTATQGVEGEVRRALGDIPFDLQVEITQEGYLHYVHARLSVDGRSVERTASGSTLEQATQGAADAVLVALHTEPSFVEG